VWEWGMGLAHQGHVDGEGGGGAVGTKDGRADQQLQPAPHGAARCHDAQRQVDGVRGAARRRQGHRGGEVGKGSLRGQSKPKWTLN
jgi:hypothetical protein